MKRSLMFLPGNTPNMILNGAYLGADMLIFDLEDAVSPDEKDAARNLVSHALRALDFGNCGKIVRINALDSGFCREDLEVIVPIGGITIMLTKSVSAEYVREVSEMITEIEQANGMPAGSTKMIPLIESTLGVENAFSIATASERVSGIALGAEDLSADLRCERTKQGEEILYARSRLVNAARAAEVDIFDTPFTDTEDYEGLEADSLRAKGLGFTGKQVISPRHIKIVNRVFSHSEAEIEYAKDVLRVIEEGRRMGKGAVSLHGKMIDRPIVLRAKRVLSESGLEEEAVYYE